MFHRAAMYFPTTQEAGPPPVNDYVPKAVSMGPNGIMQSSVDPVLSDSSVCSGSAWMNIDQAAFDSGLMLAIGINADQSGQNFFIVYQNNNPDQLLMGLMTSDYGTSRVMADVASSITSGVWFHVFWSFDISQDAGLKRALLYIDDTATESTPSVDQGPGVVLAFSQSTGFQFRSGATPGNVGYCDVWITLGSFIDWTDVNNRRKFIDDNGMAVFLGNDGSAPFGAAPEFFFSGDSMTFPTNNGSAGGSFVTTGMTDVTAPGRATSETTKTPSSSPAVKTKAPVILTKKK